MALAIDIGQHCIPRVGREEQLGRNHGSDLHALTGGQPVIRTGFDMF